MAHAFRQHHVAKRFRSRVGVRLALVLLSAPGTACASGGSGSSPAGARPPTVALGSPTFNGGTQGTDGFTNAVSSVWDSVVARPRAAIWAVMPDVFETLGIEATTVDPRSFVIGNPGSRVTLIGGSPRLSAYLQCGTGLVGPNADRYDVTLQVMVQLMGDPSGGTLLRTTLDAYARPRDSSGDPIHCSSQRTLERRILDLVGVELAGGASTIAVRGRVPVAGDLLRVECVAAPHPRIEEGLFLGVADGDLLLEVDAGSASVAVPVAQVGRVQVRERRSAAVVGGLVGAVLGIVTGAVQGRSWYKNSTKLHYQSGLYMSVGAAAGGLAGLFLGRITGSFIGTNAWLDAPDDWAGRYSLSTSPPVERAAAAPACQTFDSGG